jgi:hypothetical protein
MFARALLDADGLVSPGRARARIDTAGVFQEIRFGSGPLHLKRLAILQVRHKQISETGPFYRIHFRPVNRTKS